MTEQVITQLTSTLRFEADIRPLLRWEQALDRLSRKLKALESQAAKTKLGRTLAPSLGNPKASKEQFQAAMQHAKLQAVTDKAAAVSAAAQAKAASSRAKADAQQAKTQAAERKFSLQHEQQMLKLQQERLRAQATQSRTQAAMARAAATQAAAEAKLSKLASNAKASAAGSKWGGRFSALSHKMAGPSVVPRPMGASLDLGGIARLGSAAGGAAAGVAALAAAAAAAAYGLKMFADAANEAGAKQTMRGAQFRAITESDGPSGQSAVEAEGIFNKLANDLGLSVKATSDAYTRGLMGMVDGGMKLEQGQGTLKGILSFAKANNLGTDDQDGVLRAIGQMMSKGQLYAEEWNGQFAERMAGAAKLGAESWAEVSGSGLKGQKAAKAFKDAQGDGKIAGDKLIAFLTALATRMEKDAKRGGKLDAAINNPESQRNRVENIQQQNLVAAAKYDNERLTKSAQLLGKEWAEFNEAAKPVYEALSGPGADLNERLAKLLDTLAPHLPKLAEFINSLSAFAADVKSAPETQALGTELGRLADNLSPVLEAAQKLATIGAELAKTTAKHGTGALAGDLMIINDTLEAIPGFFDRLGKIIDQIKAKVQWLRDLLPDLPDSESPEAKERRKHYGGTPQWTKPEPLPAPGPLPPEFKPAWMNALDAHLGNQALQATVQQLNKGNTLPASAPSTATNTTVNVGAPVITINGSNLSAAELKAEVASEMEGIARDAARRGIQQMLQEASKQTVPQKR